MTNPIEFDRDKATTYVKQWGLWPMTERPENATAQQWWLSVLERVVWSVNEIDWNEEVYPEDKYTEITESAVAQWVAQARQVKQVMTICELSEVDKAMRDPFDDGIYSRLTASLIEHDKYDARREAATRLVKLGNIAEIYLEAAADDVARAWCEAMVEDWRATNPEDDDEN